MSQNHSINEKAKRIIVDDLVYSLKEADKTASVVGKDYISQNILIPRYIEHDSQKYLVTCISEGALSYLYERKEISFEKNSEVTTIEQDAFVSSKIEHLTIPSSVTDLKKGWCHEICYLKTVKVDPNNKRYFSKEDKIIYGKSTMETEIFDSLVFCAKEVKSVTLPSSVEVIETFAFQQCWQLNNVEIQPDSKLRIIENGAFSETKIECITLTSMVCELKEGWCAGANELKTVKLMPNNKNYSSIDDGKMILGKSSVGKEGFDSLVFCDRNVKSVNLPSCVEIIKSYAFNYYLLEEIIFPSDSKLQKIEKEAFLDSSIKSVTFPSSLKQICEFAFCKCFNLLKVEFPEDSQLQIIEAEAFGSSKITCLTIPSNVSQLKEGWCSETRQLTTVKVMTNNKHYSSKEDKLILSKSTTEKENFDSIALCARHIESVNIPNYIEIIEPFAFQFFREGQVLFPSDSNLRILGHHSFKNSGISCITLPSSLTVINEYAFANCYKLEKVDFAEDSKLQIIEKFAFSYSGIESFTLPAETKKICKGSFSNCQNLQNFVIPTNSKLQIVGEKAFAYSNIKRISFSRELTHIFKGAFSSCECLQTFEVPDDSKLQFIGDSAFSSTLIKTLTLPSSISELEGNWCVFMSLLESVNLMPNCKRYSSSDGKIIYGKSMLEKENFDTLVFCNRDVESLILPSSIELIAPNAFENSQIKQIFIPFDSKLRQIGAYAFKNTPIESITFPSCLTEICSYAFSNSSLKNAEFPDDSNLRIIENFAFQYSQLESFTFPRQVTQINRNTFYCCKKLRHVIFPRDSKVRKIQNNAFYESAIESIDLPSEVSEIGQLWLGMTNNLAKVSVDSKNKIFSSYDEKFILKKSSPEKETFDVLFFCVQNLKKVTIPSFIEIIDSYAFAYNHGIVNVVFSDDSKLCIIEREAFINSYITSVTFPPHLTRINEGAFKDCYRLKNVEFSPNSELEIIETEAFILTQIEKIVFPPHLTRISEGAFSDCLDLKRVEFPEDSMLKDIDAYAFCGTDIRSIIVPKQVKQISEYAFDGCIDLLLVEIDENCEFQSIDPNIFVSTSYSNDDIKEIIMVPKK